MDQEPDALVPDDADAGGTERRMVDSTLIDAMLALTPEQRLKQNDRLLRTVKELRDGFALQRSDDAADRVMRSKR